MRTIMRLEGQLVVSIIILVIPIIILVMLVYKFIEGYCTIIRAMLNKM